MIKEILCFAIIPLKNGKICLTDPNEHNNFHNSDDIIHIGKNEMMYNFLEDSHNVLFISNAIDSSSFRKRLKFCWKFLFHYK